MKLREALARRTERVPDNDASVAVTPAPEPVLDGVRRALLGGETHYTSRPGIVELRERIASMIGRESPVDYAADDVVVTSGSSEAVFVILLGLGISTGEVRAPADLEYEALFRLMGLEVARDEGSELISFEKSPFTILDVGERLQGLPGDIDAEHTLIVGNLDAQEGLGSFHVGFICGPTSAVARVRRWKQALSICTAAPSQRAAFLSLSR